MSWDSKTDYAGIAVDGVLVPKQSTENRTATYLEKVGKNGNIAATKYFGIVASPSNDYTVKGTWTPAKISLGAITVVESKNYALQTVSVKTTAGGEPTVSATAVQVEDGATAANANVFDCSGITLYPDEIAQILGGAFTLTGSDCELTECSAEISCTVNTTKINSYPVASDVVNGKVVVTATIGQYGETTPTVAAANGWELSSPLTCTDPDSDMPTWTCAFTKKLAKTINSHTES